MPFLPPNPFSSLGNCSAPWLPQQRIWLKSKNHYLKETKEQRGRILKSPVLGLWWKLLQSPFTICIVAVGQFSVPRSHRSKYVYNIQGVYNSWNSWKSTGNWKPSWNSWKSTGILCCLLEKFGPSRPRFVAILSRLSAVLNALLRILLSPLFTCLVFSLTSNEII